MVNTTDFKISLGCLKFLTEAERKFCIAVQETSNLEREKLHLLHMKFFSLRTEVNDIMTELQLPSLETYIFSNFEISPNETENIEDFKLKSNKLLELKFKIIDIFDLYLTTKCMCFNCNKDCDQLEHKNSIISKLKNSDYSVEFLLSDVVNLSI
jgi:hypothetical protein